MTIDLLKCKSRRVTQRSTPVCVHERADWPLVGLTGLTRALQFALLCSLAGLFGCKTGTLPDPNDPKDVGAWRIDDARRNLKIASDFLNDRQNRGEIDAKASQYLIAKRANEILKDLDVSGFSEKEAWKYGEFYIAARRWGPAKQALELAILHPANGERRSSDNLRLARVLAELGEIPECIARARLTFIVLDEGRVPILPAVLLEIVPAGLRKGHDVELGQLLVDAIDQEQHVLINPATEGGKRFLIARPFLIAHAYRLALETFRAAHRPDLVKKTQQEFDKWRGGLTNV